MFFAGHFGQLERVEIPDGKELVIAPYMFFAAHETTPFEIGIVGGCTGCFCGNQNFILRFKGPAVIYTRSRDFDAMYAMYAPLSEQKWVKVAIKVTKELIKLAIEVAKNAKG